MAFSEDLLPSAFAPWVSDTWERMQCPPDYPAVAAMVALAGVVGRQIAVGPQAETDWLVIPNLWGLLVGRPGLLKSPAMDAMLTPLKRLAQEAAESFVATQAEHEAALLAHKLRREAVGKTARQKLAKDPTADLSKELLLPPPEPPQLKRYLSSVEALGKLLRQNPDELLVHRDDIMSLLGSTQSSRLGRIWLADRRTAKRQGHRRSNIHPIPYPSSCNREGDMTIHTRSPPQQNPLPWELQKLQQPEKSPRERPAKTAKTLFAVIAVTSGALLTKYEESHLTIREETMDNRNEDRTEVKDAAQLTNLPTKLLWKMVREGVIGDPVADMDLRGLAIISDIWRREWFLRMALAEFSQTRREELIRKPELNRVERYVLTCYLNAKEGERIQTGVIIDRVKHYLNAPVSTKQVHRIRAMAYEIRRGRRLNP